MTGSREMGEVVYTPIGVVRSPFKDIAGVPIQPPAGRGISGTVEVFQQYLAGLKDLDGFSHIILIYHFHLSRGYLLQARPFMDENPRGVFSMRSPARPNPIGLSVVRLVKVEGSVLHVEDIDIVDGTPLLDIKPYVPDFDARDAERLGWLEGISDRVHGVRSDQRFAPAQDQGPQEQD